MKKEEIVALGIDEDVAKKLEDLIAEELKGYIPKNRFDEVNESRKKAESLVKERDSQLEELKKATGDTEELQKQIETLQEENKTAAETYQADIRQMKIDNAVEKAISERKGKNAVAIKALLDLSEAKLDDDGTVKGLTEQLDALTKAETSSFLFDSGIPQIKGLKPIDGVAPNPDVVDPSKMSYSELSAYLDANPDAQLS